jgi:hypothetical protein
MHQSPIITDASFSLPFVLLAFAQQRRPFGLGTDGLILHLFEFAEWFVLKREAKNAFYMLWAELCIVKKPFRRSWWPRYKGYPFG